MKRKNIFSLCFCALLTVSNTSAGEEVGFPKIKKWKLEVSSDVYTPDNLWDLINGAAESYVSYDFVDLHLADYSRKGVTLHVEIYRHSSPANAFGIYSSERSPDYNFIETGLQGYMEEGVLNFFTGRFYVKLYSTGSGEDVQESLRIVSAAVSGHLEQKNEWPPVLSAFPQDGKLENRDHYTRENFIGLNFLHSAFTAEYEGGYRLFVIESENKDELMAMVTAYLKFTKQEIDPEQESSFIITDKYNGDIPVVITGLYLVGVIEGPDSVEAKKKLDKLVENLGK